MISLAHAVGVALGQDFIKDPLSSIIYWGTPLSISPTAIASSLPRLRREVLLLRAAFAMVGGSPPSVLAVQWNYLRVKEVCKGSGKLQLVFNNFLLRRKRNCQASVKWWDPLSPPNTTAPCTRPPTTRTPVAHPIDISCYNYGRCCCCCCVTTSTLERGSGAGI